MQSKNYASDIKVEYYYPVFVQKIMNEYVICILPMQI